MRLWRVCTIPYYAFVSSSHQKSHEEWGTWFPAKIFRSAAAARAQPTKTTAWLLFAFVCRWSVAPLWLLTATDHNHDGIATPNSYTAYNKLNANSDQSTISLIMLLRHRLLCLAACSITACSAFAPVRSTCRFISRNDQSSATTNPSFRQSTLTSDENEVPEMIPAFPIQNEQGIYEIENQDQHK